MSCLFTVFWNQMRHINAPFSLNCEVKAGKVELVK